MAEPSKEEDNMKKKAKQALKEATDPVERMKLYFLARGGNGIKSLARWIRIMDDDGNKKLNLDEFTDGMHKLGLRDVPDAELKEVFNRFDKDGGGQLDVTEFLLAMKPKMSKSRSHLVESAFRAMDTSGDKVVTVKDLKDSYDVSRHPKYISGQWNRKKCLEEFLKTFDDQQSIDGKVTWEEFHSYYAGISCSIDNDAYFDLMMRNAWKMDEKQDSEEQPKNKAWAVGV